MTGPSPQDLLRIWEAARDQHPLVRPLTILEVAAPEHTSAEWAETNLGRRNARLLELRSGLFGATLRACAECPFCRQFAELELDAEALGTGEAGTDHRRTYEAASDGFDLRFRLLTTNDLLAAAGKHDECGARQVLVERCLVGVHQDGAAAGGDELPPAVSEALAAALDAADPGAEIVVNLTCPDCDHHWQVPLDVAAFVWAELCGEAQRLLSEVHLLAWGYGWSESAILGLSHSRRQAYLELLAG